jgi:hypothetical protein
MMRLRCRRGPVRGNRAYFFFLAVVFFATFFVAAAVFLAFFAMSSSCFNGPMSSRTSWIGARAIKLTQLSLRKLG